MRLIDADKLNVDFYDEFETDDDAYVYRYVSEHQIDTAPSIDIVRCRECKYWNMVSNGCMRNPSVEGWQADDFCSYGSRSEKPNNCEDCRHWYTRKDIYDLDDAYCELFYDNVPCKYEPKDEPQTCSFSDCDNFKNPDYERCIECKRKQIKLKTEQTERSSE